MSTSRLTEKINVLSRSDAAALGGRQPLLDVECPVVLTSVAEDMHAIDINLAAKLPKEGAHASGHEPVGAFAGSSVLLPVADWHNQK